MRSKGPTSSPTSRRRRLTPRDGGPRAATSSTTLSWTSSSSGLSGKWTGIADPSPDLTARIYALTVCGDRSRDDEWNEWYDDVHVPDILAIDGFVAATRWKLVTPAPFGANYLALYDVHGDVEAAQKSLGAAVPAMYKNGRMHPQNAMAEMAWLLPTGKYAGVGYTAGAESTA